MLNEKKRRKKKEEKKPKQQKHGLLGKMDTHNSQLSSLSFSLAQGKLTGLFLI